MARQHWPESQYHTAGRDRASRTRLVETSIGLVEDARSAGAPAENARSGLSSEFQVALPYRGLLVWHVGADAVVGDANQVLFVTAGERYRLSEPLPGGSAELIITPDLDVLAEIADTPGVCLPAHPLFRRHCRRANPNLQQLRTRFLYWATDPIAVEQLAAEELLLTLIRSALTADVASCQPRGSTQRLLRRTKELLEAEFVNPIRLRQVAHTVGASPAYLTDLFRRVEGVSLYRYVVQLRLARALIELPYAGDLAALALDLGFSHHSHFSAAFRRAFGCTPSEFRQATRAHQRPLLPHMCPPSRYDSR